MAVDIKKLPHKIHRHTKLTPGKFDKPNTWFSNLHIDILGPFPDASGYTYILTIISRFTRWSAVFPIKDISIETITRIKLQD